jgi:putative membrane-bound dehydrogenase-like protein
MVPPAAVVLTALLAAAPDPKADAPKEADAADRPLKVPDGFVVERVAGPPLVEHPMCGCFDERGRLFLTEAAGLNLNAEDLLKQLPNSIKVLEPAGADGRFDKAAVFADKMTFPGGACWLDGALYTTAYPALWRLEDAGGAVKRTQVAGNFGSIGNAADLHGPKLGPDGRLYFSDGRNGHDIRQPDGFTLKGRAAAVYRCRPDGSQLERVCGGGMDNPVEVAWTPAGEPFVCTNIVIGSPRHDAVLFALEGAVYPYSEATYSEFKMTGDPMPLTGDLGWVAVSSLIRYRGGAFGDAYRDCFFTAQFNPHRIQRHVLERDGAGVRMTTEDFITCDSPDFHPTGLLEDADGSLLVIDTGGWFRIGCPASQVAKPHIAGGVYRVRRKDAPKADDPRGLRLDWDKPATAELVKRLDDPRFMVQDRAVAALAKQRGDAVSALGERLADAMAPRDGRLNALWALTRIDDDAAARKAVRAALADADLDVRLAAAHSAGLHRDADALAPLLKMTADHDAAARRQAATALGRLGKADAVPELFDALRAGGDDRWLEHALIYALIEIGDPKATRRGLADRADAVRRGALVALDQMADGGLTRDEVAPLLSSTDPATARAAFNIVQKRPGWAKETFGLLRRWLEEGEGDAARQEMLRGLVAAFGNEPEVQDLVAQALRREKTPPALVLLLLETIARQPPERFPSTWAAELRWRLDSGDERVVRQAVACLRAGRVNEFASPLLHIADDAARPKDLRVAALAAALPQLKQASDEPFKFLCTCLGDDQPLLRLAAADALAGAPLNNGQLQQLAARVAEAGPLEAGRLVAAFERSGDAKVGKALLAGLEKSPGLASLSPGALRNAVRNYPAEVRDGAEALLKRLDVDADAQKVRLQELLPLLEGGDADRGRVVFMNGRTACATCHTVRGQGGRVGPDLSKIGGLRAPADLLESVVYPSATIARGYETYLVETDQGLSYQGVLARETADAIYLRTADRAEVRVPRSAIDSMRQGRQSIMPQGFEKQMTRDELRDLLAFLQTLK